MKTLVASLILVLLLALNGSAQAQPKQQPAPGQAAKPIPPPLANLTAIPPNADLRVWRPQMDASQQQLELIKLLALTTTFGGAKIKVPSAIKRVPLETMPDLKALHDQGTRIDVEEIELNNINVQHEAQPRWRADHPVIPGTIRFETVGVRITLKTPLGVFPVGVKFKRGTLPFDMDLTNLGFTLNIVPPQRQADALLENVEIDFGGPLASAALSGLFGKSLAQTVLQSAVGQALAMNRQDMLSSMGRGSFPGEQSGKTQDPLMGLIETFVK